MNTEQASDSVDAALVEAHLDAIAKAGLLMAAADGQIDSSELDALGELMSTALDSVGVELSPELFEEKIESIAAAMRDKTGEELLEEIGSALRGTGAAETALVVAAAVMVADGNLDEAREAPVYAALGRALGFSKEECVAVFESMLPEAEAD